MLWNTSSSNFIQRLVLTQIYLYRYVAPVFIIAGSISCILSLMVFSRKNLRKATCSIYFIAFNIANLFFILLSLLSFTLEIGFNIDLALHSLTYCRLRQYFTFLFHCLCPLYLLFASIDHALVTSPNVRIRQKSTHYRAYTAIGISALMCVLVVFHIIFFTGILQLESVYFYCYIEPGLYFIFISYISLVKEVLTPVLLIIFAYQSIKNIHTIHRIQTVSISLPVNPITVHQASSIRSKDRQFALMLLVDIGTYILFNFMMPVSLIYEQTTQNQAKTSEQIHILILIRNVAIFSVHIPFCINCYTHILVSKTFRNEVKHIFIGK